MKLVTVAEMVAVESEANAAGLTYEMMMENAGNNLAEVVEAAYGDLNQTSVVGLVGSGNNGGDTLVALTWLAKQGWDASAYLVRPRPKDDPLVQQLIQAGGVIHQVKEDPNYEELVRLLEEHAVLLDGVLGTGIRLPLKGEVAEVLDTARQILAEMDDPPQVVAVDCPSGVDSDTGEAASQCIPANLTVTMAAVKRGLLKLPAFKLLGELHLVGIGLPDGGAGMESWEAVRNRVVEAEWVRQILPERPLDGHKGTFGTAMIVAGSINYTGAAALAAEAAYRIGTGLVTLAIPTPLHRALAGGLPEVTWVLLPHELGVIAESAVEVLRENLSRATALLVGPGFGMEDTTREFIARLIGASSRPGHAKLGFARPPQESAQVKVDGLPPMVFDADGLKLLSQIPGWESRAPAPAVLTPHPGEMAIMTGLSSEEIQADRLGTALKFSQQWGHVVVLKGAFSVIAAPDGQTATVPVASPALARAGTGDVLAGLIAGLRAQGVEAFPAAVAGTWIHAQAGLQAAMRLGNSASVLARDVLQAVPDVLSEF